MTTGRHSAKRPTDWQPLTSSDPTPGDPEAIRDEIKHLKGVAEKLRAQAGDLKTVAEGEGLKGKYANDLKEKAGDLEKRLRQVASRYEEVQGPLRGWAGELEDFQEESIRLLHKAQEEENEKEAKGDDEESEGWSGSGKDQSPEARLLPLVNRYEERASYFATRIQSAVDDVVEDSGWEKFKDGVGDALNNKWVKYFFEAASWACTFIALAALIFTPAGWLIALATGLALLIVAKDVLAASTGNGSWYDLGLDLLVLASMGAGGVAVKGLKTTQVATRMASQSAASKEAMRGVLRSSRTSRARADSILERQGASPHSRAAAGEVRESIRDRALRTGHSARREEASQSVTETPKHQAAAVGGNTKFAGFSQDISRMRAQYADDAAVQQASAPAPLFEIMQTGSWSMGTAIGVAPKFTDESGMFPEKPYSHSYADWKSQFAVSSGSSY